MKHEFVGRLLIVGFFNLGKNCGHKDDRKGMTVGSIMEGGVLFNG